jgi:hypothetical protein
MESKRSTRLVRIPRDLAEKLAHLREIQGVTASQMIADLIRPEVERAYKEIEPVVKRIRRAKASVSKAG